MSGLTDQDTEQLAAKLIEKIHEQKHDFWIDPEQHYRDHAKLHGFNEEEIRNLHELIRAFRTARGLFWRAFLGFAVVGSLILAALGVGLGK